MAYPGRHPEYPDLVRHISSNYRRYPDRGQKYHSYPHFNSDSISSTFPRPVKVDSYTINVPEGPPGFHHFNGGVKHIPYHAYEKSVPDKYNDHTRRPFVEGQRYEPAITTQPISKVKQAAMVRGDERPWDSNLFDCLDDIPICLCVSCCSPFYECYVLPKDFDEHCCTGWPCCMGTFLALRYQMRKEEHIEGDLLGDSLTAMFCFHCMVCQLLREKRGINKTTIKKSKDAAAVMGQRAAEAYNEMQRW